ncbi:MAG TPA: TIR domain-containing protein [Candidatus Binatia bacterium]
MADIFISYANEDRETAAKFAQLLESVGWRVWWDRRIPAGRTWRSILEDALRDMRCLVVLWSRNSVQSPWVTEEAEEARRLGKAIIPVMIDRVEPPIGFRAIQAADLTAWNGSRDDPAAQLFLADLKSVLGEEIEGSARPSEFSSAKTDHISFLRRIIGAHIFKIGAVIVAIIVLFLGWKMWKPFSERTQRPAPEEKAEIKLPPQLATLVIRGERQEIHPSEKIKLQLSATDSDGRQAQIKEPIAWSSSAPQVASVNPEGEVSGLKPGTAEITANFGSVTSPAWTINVKPLEPSHKAAAEPKLVALRVTSASRELYLNERIRIAARGRYSDDTEQLLSREVEWQIGNRAIASINDAGEMEGLRPGKTEVVARFGQLRSPPVIVIVKEREKPIEKPTNPIPAPQSEPAKIQTPSADVKARVATYLGRAGSLREQGNYVGALAELEKARALDPSDESVRKEIEQTKRACNAERVLGNSVSC